MNELNKEQLSALVDGEHDSELVLDKLLHDDEMKATWSRYHLIGDCLRDNLPDHISSQISVNVSQALRDEPTVLAPTTTKRTNLKPLAGFAIAASVAMVAVFSIKSGNDIGTPSIETPSVAVTSPIQTETFSFSNPQMLPAAITTQSDTPESIVNQRLNNYLLNHNEYRSNVGVNGILPYVRLVTIESQE
jgi:sigma-E factor negative regulatory protein RseA